MKHRHMQAAEAPWAELVLVCSKCAAKLGRGSRGKSDLRGEIKAALKASGQRGVRVADTTCLDLCPKQGQAIAFVSVRRGTEIGVAPGDVDGAAVADHVRLTALA